MNIYYFKNLLLSISPLSVYLFCCFSSFDFFPLCLQCIYLALFYCIFAKPQFSAELLLIWLWLLITSFWTSITKILKMFITVLHITYISFISNCIGFCCCCCSNSLFLSTNLQVHSFASDLMFRSTWLLLATDGSKLLV